MVPRALRRDRNSVAPLGLERRMIHSAPADATVASLKAQAAAASPSIERPLQKHLSSATEASDLDTRFVWIFRGLVTNFVEMRRAEFHYSVIDRHATDLPALKRVGGHSLDDEVLALNFMFAAPAVMQGFFPVLGSREAKDDASSDLGRSKFQNGGRKTYADDCSLAHNMQIVISAVNIRMIRIDENIHATCPPYATVAPILHTQARNNAANRSTTFNHGATDAAGR
jgi:hypothetical protein